jgi:Flavin-binding monooxygenase-like
MQIEYVSHSFGNSSQHLISGQEIFKGHTLHSVHYTNPSAWKGKRGIVVGTANTGHDVAEDMLAAELSSVTMVQRSPTCIFYLYFSNLSCSLLMPLDVIPAEHLHSVISHSYNAHIPTTLADQFFWTFPAPIIGLLNNLAFHHAASLEPARFDALEAAGFKLNRYGNLAENIFERMGGHYVDVGASKKISDGLVSPLLSWSCLQ